MCLSELHSTFHRLMSESSEEITNFLRSGTICSSQHCLTSCPHMMMFLYIVKAPEFSYKTVSFKENSKCLH